MPIVVRLKSKDITVVVVVVIAGFVCLVVRSDLDRYSIVLIRVTWHGNYW